MRSHGTKQLARERASDEADQRLDERPKKGAAARKGEGAGLLREDRPYGGDIVERLPGFAGAAQPWIRRGDQVEAASIERRDATSPDDGTEGSLDLSKRGNKHLGDARRIRLGPDPLGQTGHRPALRGDYGDPLMVVRHEIRAARPRKGR